MMITHINDVAVAQAARERLGPLAKPDSTALQWALLSALAGRRSVARRVVLRHPDGRVLRVNLDSSIYQPRESADESGRVEWRLLSDNVGYVRLNNLSDISTVADFDLALDQLRHTKGLILDLTNTPGGGNTSVAEPILGRFFRTTVGYQRVVPREGAAYTRTVGPRGPWTYNAPVAVLVGRWTASMGEGMAIAFDGTQRGTVLGSRMAGLAGAVEELVLPCSRFKVGYPESRLLHVDGTPREEYVPKVHVSTDKAAVAIEEARRFVLDLIERRT